MPRLPLGDTHMLRDLVAAHVDIRSHTWSHPRLTSLDDATLDDEVVGAADRLEQAAGVTVRHFAYPYGLAPYLAARRGLRALVR